MTSVQLPKAFEERMQDMLKDAYPAFIHSYGEERKSALRVNTLKGTVEEFLANSGFDGLKPVAWEKRGFYYDEALRAGKHPLHEAGAYYIQEPSAMAPAAYLDAKPYEKVLDLCAAPGGKSTQIASYMENTGLLICNEINPARAKILSENIERMGIKNAVVTNETPQRLSELFIGCFDRVLVDAPCSGEGMFRKNEEAVKEWSLENVRLCAERQGKILECADSMLRAGGRLVYSTCTFSPEENEGSIAGFLKSHPDYEIEDTYKYEGMASGSPEWAGCGKMNDAAQEGSDYITSALKRTIRLFPHLIEGEGHYIAVLKKGGEVPAAYRGIYANGLQKGIKPKEIKELLEFAGDAMNTSLFDEKKECIVRFGGQLYLMPDEMPSIDKLKVLRAGLHLGTLKKNRFEPSHALALALKSSDAKRTYALSDDEAAAFINGQAINIASDAETPVEKGWLLMTYKGYSIGWGKLAGQMIKNHYPKGLRK